MSNGKRTPVLRPATKAEELAKLHPLERNAYRVFEFLSSVKMALIVLPWLIVECIAGTLLESQVNILTAHYFVYGSYHFHACMWMMATNILCAALIRFPWKFYQTGFVITHLGLLLLLFGCLLSSLNHIDSLMVAAKLNNQPENERWQSTYADQTRELLEIAELDPKTETPLSVQRIKVDLGPFTWGDKVFGVLPWRDGFVETHRTGKGDEIKIKRFYANCIRRDTYVPVEKGIIGVNAANLELGMPERQMFARWVEFPEVPRSVELGFGSFLLWRTSSEEYFQHFLSAVPKEPSAEVDEETLYGTLVLDVDGKPTRFKVDSIRRSAVPIPGRKNQMLQVIEFFPDAKPGPKPGTLVAAGDVLKNPGLLVQITTDGKAVNQYLLPNGPSNDALQSANKPIHNLRYIPPGTSAGDSVMFGVTYAGKHAIFSLAQLQAGFVPIVGTNAEIRVEEYLPDADLDRTKNKLVSRGPDPNNPAANLEMRVGGQPPIKLLCFENSMFNVLADSRNPARVSMFLPKRKAALELCMAPNGELACRAWSSQQGLVACQKLTLGKPLPVWPIPQFGTMISLVAKNVAQNARRDTKLYPENLVPGQAGERGAELEIRTFDNAVISTAVHRHPESMEGGVPNIIRLGGRVIQLRLTHEENTVPFKIRLEDFVEPKIPGTRAAAMYTSIVTLKDEKNKVEEKRSISMNFPLRYEVVNPNSDVISQWGATIFPMLRPSFTLYQTSISHTPDGPISTYTVSYDPGLPAKYAGWLTLCTGMATMYYMGGYFRKSRRTSSAAESTNQDV